MAAAGGVALGALVPVAASAHAYFTRPLGDAGSITTHPSVVLVAFFAPAVAVLGYLLATRRSLSLIRTIAAWAVAIAGALAFVLAARRTGDVDRERFVRDMRVVGELGIDGPPLTVGALSIALQEPGNCHVRITTIAGAEIYPWPGLNVGSCTPVRVKHDTVNDVAVIEYVPLWAAPASGYWQVLAVHSTRDGRAVSLDDVKVFRGSLFVPTDWAMLAAFSTAFAWTMLLTARVHRRRAAALASATDAVHEGDGWFALEDGRRFFVHSAVDWVLGSFIVQVQEPAIAGNYRTSASTNIEPVVPGTRQDRVEEPRACADSCESVALASAAIGMMPALVALLVLNS